jgi:hypothetical protein
MFLKKYGFGWLYRDFFTCGDTFGHVLYSLKHVFSGEATYINFIVFGLTRPGLEHTNYRIRGEHANLSTTDEVFTMKKV